jgi:hypothetical protein
MEEDVRMSEPVCIFERDKWNKIIAITHGRAFEVIEISDQWGEDTHHFSSRAALQHWVEARFSATRFEGTAEERQHILEQFSLL